MKKRMNKLTMNENSPSQIQMIADYEGDIEQLLDVTYEGPIAILATRNIMMFPGVLCPIIIGREQSKQLVQMLEGNPDTVFAVFCQHSMDKEQPGYDDLYHTGVYAKLVKVMDVPMPGGNKTAVIQALGRCNLVKIGRAHV